MEKLLTLFKHADKVVHFIGGFLIALLVSFVTPDKAFWFGASLLAGGAKEFYDSYTKKAYGLHQFIDWGATMLGGILAVIIL